MLRKGNLAFLKVKGTPNKIGVHACDSNPYLHIFFELIPID